MTTRSLRLPHSPDAATAAAGQGLPPPPPRRRQTPEALSGTGTAQSSGRLRRQRRSLLLRPGKLPRTRPQSRFATGGSAPPAAQRSPIGREIAAAHLGCSEGKARSPAGQDLGGEGKEITTASWGSAQCFVILTDPHDKGLTCVSSCCTEPWIIILFMS